MSGYRHPRMGDNELDLRTMAEKEADERDTGGLCLFCRGGSHKNCRKRGCPCPSSVHVEDAS